LSCLMEGRVGNLPSQLSSLLLWRCNTSIPWSFTQQLPGGVILMEEVRVDQRRNENPILLRDEIDDKSHKLLHLKRSQEELQETMRMIYPEEDSDLSTAYNENHSIILRIENEINELKDILIEIDAAYAIEETLSTQIPKKEFPIPNETQGIYL
jgi:hypothetical protein